MKQTKLSRLLARQLKNVDLEADALPENLESWQAFLAKVDNSYTENTESRYLLERSLKKFSAEMEVLFEDLKKESDARIQALQKSEFKSRFLANMSHEIRTPMNGVMGMLELVLDGDIDPVAREYLEIAYASSQSLLTVINAVLDLSKVESGRMELEHIPFNLREVVDEIGASFYSAAELKGLELNIYVDPDLTVMVKGDPVRLRQVLSNLIGNAIKFTNSGDVLLDVRMRSLEKTTVLLDFEVRDSGIGIPQEVQEALFQPFVQADNSITRKYGGTGLGLVIAQEIVKQMGGAVILQSEEGVGSNFSFSISFARSHAIEEYASNLEGVEVLIVDDNLTNIKILTEYVQKFGATAHIAENGKQALDFLHKHYDKQQSIDIALIDMQMPDIDGITLGEMIKARPQWQAIAMVMVSSVSQPLPLLLDVGFALVLHKPVSMSSLFNALLSLVSSDVVAESETSGVLTRAYDFAGKKILLVEDNLVNQKVTGAMLEKLGVTYDLVANGVEALVQLGDQHAQYDVVLMDCEMPEMDGFSATLKLREIEAKNTWSRKPVVAMTARALKGDKEKCLAAEMDDYLTKPASLQDIAEHLQKWM